MSKNGLKDDKSAYYRMNSKLCKLVQSYPCMYDSSSSNYLKKEYIDVAWAAISLELNDTVAACKERWSYICKAYVRYLSKIAVEPNLNKKYYLHDDLEFLRKHLSPSIRVLTPAELVKEDISTKSTDIKAGECCTFEIIELESPPPPKSTDEKTLEEEGVVIIHSDIEIEPESKPSPEPEPVPVPLPEPAPEPEQSKSNADPSSPVKKRYRRTYEEPTVSKPRTRGADSVFLDSILPEMKNMNARQKILFKAKVYQALAEVFSDCKDFPSKDNPASSDGVAQSTLPSSLPVTRSVFPLRSYGNRRIVTEKSCLTPTIHSAQNQSTNAAIKEELQEIDD